MTGNKAFEEGTVEQWAEDEAETLSINTKQERYLDEDGSGEDLIDHWAKTRTRDQFRAIMYAMVEKYNKRLGKKDLVINEVAKMADYMNRWLEYERIWAKEDNGYDLSATGDFSVSGYVLDQKDMNTAYSAVVSMLSMENFIDFGENQDVIEQTLDAYKQFAERHESHINITEEVLASVQGECTNPNCKNCNPNGEVH